MITKFGRAPKKLNQPRSRFGYVHFSPCDWAQRDCRAAPRPSLQYQIYVLRFRQLSVAQVRGSLLLSPLPRATLRAADAVG